jgi:hypothetical protein
MSEPLARKFREDHPTKKLSKETLTQTIWKKKSINKMIITEH